MMCDVEASPETCLGKDMDGADNGVECKQEIDETQPEFCFVEENNFCETEEEEDEVKDLFWCHICQLSFLNGIELANHFRSRVCWDVIFGGKGATLSCLICKIPVKSKKQHWLDRHKRPDRACQYCGTTYMKSKFNKHVNDAKCHLKFFTENDKKELRCKRCGREVLPTCFWMHKCPTVEMNGTFKCGNCNAKFFKEMAYKKHSEEGVCRKKVGYSGNQTKSCQYCKDSYKVGFFTDHINEVGCFLEYFDDVGEDGLKCKLCHKTTNMSNFVLHQCEKRITDIKCAYCSKKFSTLRARSTHYHGTNCGRKKYTQVSKSKWKCKKCKILIDVSLKTRHKCRKKGSICEYCKKDMRPYSKRVHLQTCIDTLFDVDGGVTKCKNCGHGVNPQRSLKILHVRQCIVGVVTKRDRERPSKIGVSNTRTLQVECKCVYCHLVFKSEIELRNHRRKERGKCYLPSYSSVNPLLSQCKECGYVTNRKGMTKHCLRGCYSTPLKVADGRSDPEGFHFLKVSNTELICLKCNNVRLWREVNLHYMRCWGLK